MPVVEFSKKDIKRSTLLEPGWYHVKVEEVSEKLASKQTSTNYMVEILVLANADNGETEICGGVPVMMFFNSKALGFMVPFAAALAEDDDDEPKEGSKFNLEAAVGRELEVFIANETRDNQLQNQATNQYRKVGAGN